MCHAVCSPDMLPVTCCRGHVVGSWYGCTLTVPATEELPATSLEIGYCNCSLRRNTALRLWETLPQLIATLGVDIDVIAEHSGVADG